MARRKKGSQSVHRKNIAMVAEKLLLRPSQLDFQRI